MPLNSNHKKFINTVIDPLLDVKLKRSKKAKRLIASLNEAMQGEHNVEGEYYHLGQCLVNPQKFLSGLEKSGDTCIYKVQQYILRKIDLLLTMSGVANEEKLIKWGWNAEDNRRKFSVNHEFFKTEVTVHDDLIVSTWDLALPNYPDRVYEQNLKYGDTGNIILGVEFSFDAPDVEMEIQVPYFNGDAEEEAAIERLKEKAEKKALKLAAHAVIDYLFQRGRIALSSEEMQWIEPHIRLLLTNQYWFDGLHDNKDDDGFMFAVLVRRNSLQARNLTSKTIIGLIENEIVSVDDVVNLPDHLRLLIEHPYYLKLIKDELYAINDFRDLDESQAKVLRHPRVVYLLQKNKVTMEVACNLSMHLLVHNNMYSLLTSTLYDFYFTQPARIDWESIMRVQLHEVAFLMRPEVISFIENDCLSIRSIVNLNENAILTFTTILTALDAAENRIFVLSIMLLLVGKVNGNEKTKLRSELLESINTPNRDSLLRLMVRSILQLFEAQYKNQSAGVRKEMAECLNQLDLGSDVLSSLSSIMMSSPVYQKGIFGLFQYSNHSEVNLICTRAVELFKYLHHYLMPLDIPILVPQLA